MIMICLVMNESAKDDHEKSHEEKNLKAFVAGEDGFHSDDDIRVDNKFLKADNESLKNRLKAVEGKLGTLAKQLLDLVNSQEKVS